MTAINTEVLANPSSCREGAQYMAQLAEANHDAGTALHKARSNSESVWKGAASEAFREQANHAGRDTDELERICRKVSRALTSFADDIATCESRMNRALDAAREGGLVVRGTWIEKPLEDPIQVAPQGVGSPSLPGLDPTYHEKEDLKRRLDAWSEAEGLVDWARRLENTAHEELNAALDDANALVASVTKPSTWIGNSLAVIGAAHGAATKLRDLAAKQAEWFDKYKQLSADSRVPAATRQASITKMMMNIGITESQAASNARMLGNLGDTKVGNILFNPLTKTFGGTKPGALRGLGRMGTIGGFVFTSIDTGRQIIMDGKPVGKTIASNFAGYGVGAMAGGTAALGAGAVGLVGGPVTVLGVGVGAAATWVYGYSQENTWQDFQHDSKEAGRDVLDRHSRAQEDLNEAEQQHPGSTPLAKW